MHNEVMSTRTVDGCVELLDDSVRIIRRVRRDAPGINPEAQEIPLAAIRAMRCHKPGLVHDGYVQLAFETRIAEEYAVVCHARDHADVQRLQAAIAERVSRNVR